MKWRDLIFGFFIGITATFLGSFLFITLVMKHNFIVGITYVKNHGLLGKIITLGAILNLIAFAILLKFNKEIMARGVILATLILTALTLII